MILTLMWMMIGCVILAVMMYLLIRCFRFVSKVINKIQILKSEIEELYYFTSRNNDMLDNLYGLYGKKSPKYHFDDSWSDSNPIICHALGEIDGVKFTECKEAFEKHYNEGSRVFELDFSLTSDGEPIVLHDWNKFKEEKVTGITFMNHSMSQAMSVGEFEQVKILGKYTPLTLERFIQSAKQYTDTYYIISVKSLNQRYDEDVRLIFHKLFDLAMTADERLCERFILHAYSIEFLHKAMEEFRFNSAVYGLRRCIHPMILAEQLNRYGISVITTDMSIGAWSRKYLNLLHENDIKVILCSMKGKKEAKKRLKESYIDMVMTPYGEEIRQ